MSQKPFDVLVYGATGFTGQQAAGYLQKTYGERIKFAIAGRNRSKLEALAEKLGIDQQRIVIADSQNVQEVDRMAAQARVLINTAGPFAKYAEPVITACINHRTSYVDITGETPFIRDMIDRYHDKATKQGVRIIPFCGFDSIPSDLGSLFIVDYWQKQAQKTRLVKSFFQIKGGFNGGTIASALNMAETGQQKRLADPLLLNPPSKRTKEERRRSREPNKPTFDDDLQKWSAPFFMAPVNSAVVRRSRALWEDMTLNYGDQFEYHERWLVTGNGKPIPAFLSTAASGSFLLATQSKLGRKLLGRLAPNPGEGPSQEAIESGFFRNTMISHSEDGQRIKATVSGQGDPGNKATVLMLCESALHLLQTPAEQLPGGVGYGGILTPASGLGLGMISRLQQAGIQFKIEGKL